MHRQHLFPLRELKLHDRRDHLNAGVAHQNIDGTERLDYLGGACVHLLLVGDVHGKTNGALAAGVDLCGGRVGGPLIQIRDGHFCALAGKHQRDLLANSAGRAGDDCGLVLEAHGVSLEAALSRKREAIVQPLP
jgi:hypothetical protein